MRWSASRNEANKDLLACLSFSRSALLMFSLNSIWNRAYSSSLKPSSAARRCAASRLFANFTSSANVCSTVTRSFSRLYSPTISRYLIHLHRIAREHLLQLFLHYFPNILRCCLFVTYFGELLA